MVLFALVRKWHGLFLCRPSVDWYRYEPANGFFKAEYVLESLTNQLFV